MEKEIILAKHVCSFIRSNCLIKHLTSAPNVHSRLVNKNIAPFYILAIMSAVGTTSAPNTFMKKKGVYTAAQGHAANGGASAMARPMAGQAVANPSNEPIPMFANDQWVESLRSGGNSATRTVDGR